MVFAREVDGLELTFGVSGKLIMNAVVLYDHQTDSLWSQFLAQAVAGPLAGTRLELISSSLTTWEAWSEEHPDTLLLDRSGGFFASSGDSYAGYFRSQQAGILGEANHDPRLPVKELVVGLDHGVAQRAYAFRDLARDSVVNDVYQGEAIVVAFDTESESAAVFSREAAGQLLTFTQTGRRTMQDAETGSTWSMDTGRAMEGPLAGTDLERVRSFVSFWFAWSDFYPETEVYEPMG
jgi:hypothetical protein